MQKIETEIKEDKYNKEDNPLPIAFVKYWNLIHSTLFDETHLFNNIYFLVKQFFSNMLEFMHFVQNSN